MMRHDPLPAIVDSLFSGDTRRVRSLRQPVAAMRREYAKPVPCVDYRNADLARAYMVAYFPYYVEPLHRLLESLPVSVTGPALGKSRIEVCVIGCGPAPEVLGLSTFVAERFPDVRHIDVSLHDANIDNWKPYIGLSLSHLVKAYWPGRMGTNMVDCSLLRDCRQCESITCHVYRRTADVHIVQNCLNDVGAYPDVVSRKLMRIMRSAKPGALFILVNAVSGVAARVMRSLEAYAVASGVGVVCKSVRGTTMSAPAGFDLPLILKDHLFTGGDGLIAKRYVRFISSVIVRSHSELGR